MEQCFSHMRGSGDRAHREEALLVLDLVAELVQLLLLALGQVHLPRQVAQLLCVVRLPPLYVLRSSSPQVRTG